MKALNNKSPEEREVSPAEARSILEQQALAAVGKVGTEPEGIEFDMDALVIEGALEREITTIKGLKVVMKALEHWEHKAVLAEVSKKLKKTDDPSNIETLSELKVPTLIRAIKSVNGMVVQSEASRNSLRQWLEKQPSILVDLLYLEQQKLMADQLELLEEGKKNSQ